MKNELMNLMNLFLDSAVVICFCCGVIFWMDTRQSTNPAGRASKFISSFKNLINYGSMLKQAFLLIKRLKNDEFMNINEQTWGLFPSFAMERMNMRFLNELRVLQVHCKFIGSSYFGPQFTRKETKK